MFLELLTIAYVAGLVSSASGEPLKARVERLRRSIGDQRATKDAIFREQRSTRDRQRQAELRESMREAKEASERLHRAYLAAQRELQEAYDDLKHLASRIDRQRSEVSTCRDRLNTAYGEMKNWRDSISRDFAILKSGHGDRAHASACIDHGRSRMRSIHGVIVRAYRPRLEHEREVLGRLLDERRALLKRIHGA